MANQGRYPDQVVSMPANDTCLHNDQLVSMPADDTCLHNDQVVFMPANDTCLHNGQVIAKLCQLIIHTLTQSHYRGVGVRS
jgi:hypothetical protein